MPPYNANDPTATFMSSSCLDLLLIELVPMAYRVTNELEAASTNSCLSAAAAASANNNNAGSSSSESVSVATGAGAAAGGGSSILAGGIGGIGGGATGAGSKRVMDEEEERDAVFYRLEMLGYRVGQGLVERCVHPPPSPSWILRADTWALSPDVTGSRETGRGSTIPST